MEIRTGKVFKWEAQNDVKYYFVENDLASISEELAGLHWCRIYFKDGNTGAIHGYKTILGTEYFIDLKKAVGENLSEITSRAEIDRVTALFARIDAPLRRY
jgi:hypothetical protein